jgi:hypothetical protein
MAEPILKLTRGVPKNDREWMDVFRNLTKFLRVSGDELIIGGGIVLPEQSVGTPELEDLAVTDVKLRQSQARSVIGRAVGSAGAPADIQASTDGHYLRQAGGVLSFGTIADGDIPATVARDSEVSTAISTAISNHEAAPDPHAQYTTAAELSAAIAALSLASGTYTPTLTGVANVDASTAYVCQYLRIGSVVTVSGQLDIDPTTSAVATELGISLPIASDFTSTNQCGGTASALAITQAGGILADVTNNRAELRFLAATNSARAMHFTFAYLIA